MIERRLPVLVVVIILLAASGIRAQDVTLVMDFNPTSGRDSWVQVLRPSLGDLAFVRAKHLVEGDWDYTFRTDGTEEGTVRFLPVVDPYYAEVFRPGYVLNGHLIFWGDSDTSSDTVEIFRTDGTTAGTKRIWAGRHTWPAASLYNPETEAAGDLVYFVSAEGSSSAVLWRTDGTSGGTFRLLSNDTASGPSGFEATDPSNLIAVGNDLFFAMRDESGIDALWKTDGTREGTFPVRQIPFLGKWEGPESRMESPWVTVKTQTGTDRLFFLARNGTGGKALWMSEGHLNNTGMIKDLGSAREPWLWFGYRDSVYFWANGNEGLELWRSDGTTFNTVRVDALDGLALGPRDVYYLPPEVLIMNDLVYLVLDDGIHGTELWRSDMTRAGTWMLQDLTPGELPPGTLSPTDPGGPRNTYPRDFTRYRNGFYFWGTEKASDGVSHKILCWSDGTGAGTQVVESFEPLGVPPLSSIVVPHNLVTAGDRVYFAAARDDEFGLELYMVEGTPPAPGEGRLENLSTRGRVGTGDEAMIAGFIVKGGRLPVLIRGIGPSLSAFGISGLINDPQLQLFSGSTPIASNDDWRDTQEAEILASGKAPGDNRESAIVIELDEGAYTAIMTGVGGTTGVGLVEINDLLDRNP